MKKDEGFIDPTRFLEGRLFHFQPYQEACNDYKLVWKVSCTINHWRIIDVLKNNNKAKNN
jgi:hypothetical protein